MKISEVIKELEYELTANGDCEVTITVGVMKDVIVDGKVIGGTMDPEGHSSDNIMFCREGNGLDNPSTLDLRNFPY
jgi:hypothetical protein